MTKRKILIIGAGGIGSFLISFLDRIGLYDMTVFDPDKVEKKNIYGNELLYPVCQRAKIFAILTGQKTLSTGAIIKVKQLGYSVKEYINREL